MAKVLIVDDELFYREHVGDVLKKAGHEVIRASSGKEAVDLLPRTEGIDLVLCDVVMPGFDGMAVLSKVKKFDENIPVIMLSGHEDHRTVLLALRKGAFDYQKKPISPQELVLTVQRAADLKKLQQDQKTKLDRLVSLENGSKKLSEMVLCDVSLEGLSEEYELLDITVQMVSELLDCNRVSIMILDPTDKRLKVAVSVGLSKNLIKEESKPADKSVSSYVLETGQGILVTDADEDKRVPSSGFSGQYKTNSFVVAPIIIGDQVVGTINANDKKDKAPFNEEDLFMLRTLGHQASVTLSLAIRNSEMERDRVKLKRLSDFQKILIRYLEPQDMLRDLLRNCQEQLNVMNAAVFLKDDFTEDLQLRMGFNGENAMSKKLLIKQGVSITGLAAKQGKIFLLNKPESDKRFVKEIEWPGKGKIRGILAAPIRFSNSTIGVIRLLNKRDGVFTKEDAALLKDVTDSLAIAIRNMMLYEQLNQSVEEIILANRNLELVNDELRMKAKELEVLKKAGLKKPAKKAVAQKVEKDLQLIIEPLEKPSKSIRKK
jgi:CheY-like chemotaxis protein